MRATLPNWEIRKRVEGTRSLTRALPENFADKVVDGSEDLLGEEGEASRDYG